MAFIANILNINNGNSTGAASLMQQFNEYEFNEKNWEQIRKKLSGLDIENGEISSKLEKLHEIFLKIGKPNEKMNIDVIVKNLKTIEEVMRFAGDLKKNILGVSLGKWHTVFNDNVIQKFTPIPNAIRSGKDVTNLIKEFNLSCKKWIDQKTIDVKFAGDCLEILSVIIAQKLLGIVQPLNFIGPIKYIFQPNMVDTNNRNLNLNLLRTAYNNFNRGKYELEDMKNVIETIEMSDRLNEQESAFLDELYAQLEAYKGIHDDIVRHDRKDYAPCLGFFDRLKRTKDQKQKLEKKLASAIKTSEKEIEDMEKEKNKMFQNLKEYSAQLKQLKSNFLAIEKQIKGITSSNDFEQVMAETKNPDSRETLSNMARYILKEYLEDYLNNSLSFTVGDGRDGFIRSVDAIINHMDEYVDV